MTRWLVVLALLIAPKVAQADITAPEAVVDLSIFDIGRTTVVMHFTAPHEDGSSGGAVSVYDIRYSTSPITDLDTFNTATKFLEIPTPPQSPGSTECADTYGLAYSTFYYVAMRSRDDVGLWSPLSNVVSFHTHNTGPDPYCP